MTEQTKAEWNAHIFKLQHFIQEEFTKGCTGVDCRDCFFVDETPLCDMMCDLSSNGTGIENKTEDKTNET